MTMMKAKVMGKSPNQQADRVLEIWAGNGEWPVRVLVHSPGNTAGGWGIRLKRDTFLRALRDAGVRITIGQ